MSRPRPSQLALVALAAAAAVWAAVSLLGGEEGRIRRRLDELGGLLAKERGEAALHAAAKARSLGELFSPSFEIALAPWGSTIRDRQSLQRSVLGFRSRAAQIEVGFRIDELVLEAGERAARLTAVATVAGTDAERVRRARYRVVLDWQKTSGDWYIRRVKVLEELDGPAIF